MTQRQFIPFDNSYARLPTAFYTKLPPTPVAAPSLIAYNKELANLLDLAVMPEASLTKIFSGTSLADGSEPLAQLYSGHQFGHFNPQLGDGRAHLLGEVMGKDGLRYDIQLKGSGITPYSRNGDGRAWLGPVLREYVVSEAMNALGISTTRALAAVSTGEHVYRQTALPGAVLTRVAESHIRVGTFQIFAARKQFDHLRTLYEYARARHYPDATDPLSFLDCVIARQAKLIAQWMGVGFIHGVMNTDNCAISGQTIDYGPCAFMDRYDPRTVFSSIDHMGRYSYANQPAIVTWNMAQLATALVPLMPDTDVAIDLFTKAVHALPDMIEEAWLSVFGAKLGIAAATEEDKPLIQALLSLLHEENADFTLAFHDIAHGNAPAELAQNTEFLAWSKKWQRRLASEQSPETRARAANPYIIPRNHKIEAMIQSALQDDFGPFHRLNRAFQDPYTSRDDVKDLSIPPCKDEEITATFCGT